MSELKKEPKNDRTKDPKNDPTGGADAKPPRISRFPLARRGHAPTTDGRAVDTLAIRHTVRCRRVLVHRAVATVRAAVAGKLSVLPLELVVIRYLERQQSMEGEEEKHSERGNKEHSSTQSW